MEQFHQAVLIRQGKNGNVVIVNNLLNETGQVSNKNLFSFSAAHVTSLASWWPTGNFKASDCGGARTVGYSGSRIQTSLSSRFLKSLVALMELFYQWSRTRFQDVT